MNFCTAHPRSCTHPHFCTSMPYTMPPAVSLLKTVLLASISIISTALCHHIDPVVIPWCSYTEKPVSTSVPNPLGTSPSTSLLGFPRGEGGEGEEPGQASGTGHRGRRPNPHRLSRSSGKSDQKGWKAFVQPLPGCRGHLPAAFLLYNLNPFHRQLGALLAQG